jgi:hypothetical protein
MTEKTSKMIDTFRVVDQSQTGEVIFRTLSPSRAEQIADQLRRTERWFDRTRYVISPEGEGCRITILKEGE